MSDLKVFSLNDCDWWIGASLETCIADYIEVTGDPDSLEDPYELRDEQLKRLLFEDEDGRKNSFEEQRDIEINIGGPFPRMFASTER